MVSTGTTPIHMNKSTSSSLTKTLRESEQSPPPGSRVDLVGLNVYFFETELHHVAQAGLLSAEIAFPKSIPSGEFIKSTRP